MLSLLSRISTWLFVEMIATLTLILLNMTIPIVMLITSYRNLVNFYFSSVALSSSLINSLYLFYLFQTSRAKILSEINCRAIYYLHTSCIVVLAYTVVAMHANFVLYLFPSSSEQHHSTRTCCQSCGVCLRRTFRRFCFCFVLCVWSISFTSTVPLLYSIDSNEKSPKPVYCPGTKEINYLDEWFDKNRFIQTTIFNLVPLTISLLLTLLALLKLFYDCFFYIYLRMKLSLWKPCRKRFYRQQQKQALTHQNSLSPSSIGNKNSTNIQNEINLAPLTDMPTDSNGIIITSSNLSLQTCGHWFISSFLRFLLILSCCLLACIYPIVMRFYLVYFSVLVPLIFAILNYSLGQTIPTQQHEPKQQVIIESRHKSLTSSNIPRSSECYTDKLHQTKTNTKLEQDNEQIELKTALLNHQNETVVTKLTSSPSLPKGSNHIHNPLNTRYKRKSFANHLYENTRNVSYTIK